MKKSIILKRNELKDKKFKQAKVVFCSDEENTEFKASLKLALIKALKV